MVSVGLLTLLLVEYRIVYLAEFLKMHIDLVIYSYTWIFCVLIRRYFCRIYQHCLFSISIFDLHSILLQVIELVSP